MKINENDLRQIIHDTLIRLKENVTEKSVSKSQQRFFGMVDAYKKGELDNASKAVKDAADGMSMKQVKDFAKTKHKGLPNHVNEEYSTQGGMTNDNDIQAFERFVHNYPDLPECGWLGRANGELQTNNQVLMMYRDLSYKIYNALPSESTKESYHWLCNAYDFLKRGDKEKANFSYHESIKMLVDALEKIKKNPMQARVYESVMVNESFKSRIIKRFADEHGIGSSNPALSEITDDMIYDSEVVNGYPEWAANQPQDYVIYKGNDNAWLVLNVNDKFRSNFKYDYFDWGKQQPYPNGKYNEINRRKWGANNNDNNYMYQSSPRFKNALSKQYTSKDFSNDMRWKRLNEAIKESVHTQLIKTLGKYTQGEVSSKQANKAIMDLANSTNQKTNK